MRRCNCCISNISVYDNDEITSNCKINLTHFNDAKITLYRCQMQKILWSEIYICFNCSQRLSARHLETNVVRFILRSCNNCIAYMTIITHIITTKFCYIIKLIWHISTMQKLRCIDVRCKRYCEIKFTSVSIALKLECSTSRNECRSLYIAFVQ